MSRSWGWKVPENDYDYDHGRVNTLHGYSMVLTRSAEGKQNLFDANSLGCVFRYSRKKRCTDCIRQFVIFYCKHSKSQVRSVSDNFVS